MTREARARLTTAKYKAAEERNDRQALARALRELADHIDGHNDRVATVLINSMHISGDMTLTQLFYEMCENGQDAHDALVRLGLLPVPPTEPTIS